MAAQAFDDGDYDAAADYAKQAKDYASLSDQYVEKMLAKAAADKAHGPGQGQDGLGRLHRRQDSLSRRLRRGLRPVLRQPRLVQRRGLPGIGRPGEADHSGSRQDRAGPGPGRASQGQGQDGLGRLDRSQGQLPGRLRQGRRRLCRGQLLHGRPGLPDRRRQGRRDHRRVDAIAKADADAAIAQAKDAMSEAEAISAPTNYPKEYASAKAELADAQTAYEGKDYPTAAHQGPRLRRSPRLGKGQVRLAGRLCGQAHPRAQGLPLEHRRLSLHLQQPAQVDA